MMTKSVCTYAAINRMVENWQFDVDTTRLLGICEKSLTLPWTEGKPFGCTKLVKSDT